GVVLKQASSARLFSGIRTVAEGEMSIGDDTMSEILQAITPVPSGRHADAPKDLRLTPREQEIVRLVVQGFTNREIAGKLGVGEDTIKHHLTNVFDKTGVPNRLELALFSIHHGLATGIPEVLQAAR